MTTTALLRCSLLAMLGIVAIAGTRSAGAICLPTAVPKYVGPAGNTNCNYSTIQAAIDANPNCPVVIAISRQQTYSGQAIVINNQNLTLTGVGQCGATAGGGRPATDSPSVAPTRTPIAGDGVNPVFKLSGTSRVTFANLSISGGKGAANSTFGAGGIGYNGVGSITLQNVELHDNSGNSGGLAYTGSGALNLAGVSIHDNTASSCGGGMALSTSFGQTLDVTFVENADVANDLFHNHAANCGGGLFASGGVHLEALSTRAGGFLVRDNDAVAGGGIDWQATGGADLGFYDYGIGYNTATVGGGLRVGGSGAPVRIFGTRPDLPAIIEGNRATTVSGGGVYVGGGANGTATLCLFETSLALNKAATQGSAAFVASGGKLLINPENDDICRYGDVAALGAVHCAGGVAGAECGTVLLNSGQTTGGTPTAANVLHVDHDAELRSRRTLIYSNYGGSVIGGASSANAVADFRECLIRDNTVSGALIDSGGGAMNFDACTIARNSIGAANVLAAPSPLSIRRSIVNESLSVYAPGGGAPGLVLQYDLINEPKRPTEASVVYGTAGFVDAANGDFHLIAQSPALDFAPAGDNLGGDLDRQPREVDYPGVASVFGNRDLGAYERQADGASDRIFLGQFE